tara:strand:+ start:286 stop:576 length:291 start_codon:yes stop_codon:yes gene_type:complete
MPKLNDGSLDALLIFNICLATFILDEIVLRSGLLLLKSLKTLLKSESSNDSHQSPMTLELSVNFRSQEEGIDSEIGKLLVENFSAHAEKSIVKIIK